MLKNKTIFIFSMALLILCFSCAEKYYEDLLDEKAEQETEAQNMLIRENIDFSQYTVNYFEIDDFDTSQFKIKEDDSPFKIVDYAPVDELPVEMKKPTIYVVFSQPVVPLSKLGEVITDSTVMEIDPPIKGIFRWYGSKLLSFEPDEETLPQREYTVTISDDVKSLGGKSLEGDRSFSFITEYLNIAYFKPGLPNQDFYSQDDVPMEAAKYITVQFTYPVNLDVIKSYVEVKCRQKKLNISVSRPEEEHGITNQNLYDRTVIITIKDTLQEDTDVTFTLLKGARSEEDYIGRPDSIDKTYHTLRPFIYQYYDTYSYYFPRSEKGDSNPIYIEFSHPVDMENIERYFSTSLSVEDYSDKIYVWGTYVKLTNLPVTYESTYKIYIDKGLKDIYGRTLGTSKTLSITVPPASSYYYFPNIGTKMLEAAFPPKIIFEYQNIFDGVWKVDSITNPYVSFQPEELVPYDFSGLQKNVKHFEVLDLSPWLNDSGKGFVGISWNFAEKKIDGTRPTWGQNNLRLQVTDMGATVRYAYNKILVWVASLSTGKPVKNATVYLKRDTEVKMQQETDNNGLAVFTLDPGQYRSLFYSSTYRYDRLRIFIEKDDDKIDFYPDSTHNVYHFGIYYTYAPYYAEVEQMQTFLFTDRGLYKPGETITYRGIDRNLAAGEYSVYQGFYQLSVRENTYNSEPFFTTSGYTSDSGGFYGEIELPEDLEPGYYQIEYTRDGKTKGISFQVAFFRRLNFSVSVQKPDITYYLGDTLSFTAQATYLAGGVLTSATYDYFWAKEPVYFRPKGLRWKTWRFGPEDYWGGSRIISSGSGVLDALGQVQLKQESTEEGITGLPYRYQLEVRVQDIDRQEVSSYQSAIVHPADFYIGTKLASGKEGWWSTFVEKGKPATFEFALVKPDGELYLNFSKKIKVTAQLIHRSWKLVQQQGVYGYITTNYELMEEVVDSKELELNQAEGKIEFTPEEAGSYMIKLEASDLSDRSAVTVLRFYATGSTWIRWGAEDTEDINLITDRDIYEAGETAIIMVQSPLPEGNYLLTIEREGIFEEKIIELKGSANVIEIPVKEEYLPIFYVAICSYTKREAPPTSYFEPDLGKPKGYFGIVPIRVSPDPRLLTVKITSDKTTYRPGTEGNITIQVLKNNQPVPDAEVTFLAVDRGVLDLINYHVPDPIKFFYSPSKFPLCVYGMDTRKLLIDPVTYEIKDLQGGDDEGSKLEIRKDFRPLAIFEPFLKTDENGEVTVSFTFPDTLTTYRSTALVVKDDFFGITEKELLVQNPINVKTALPRRLRVRDTCAAGVIITNLDDEEQTVTVSLKTDILGIEGADEKTVTVPAGRSMEVSFIMYAMVKGLAKLEFTILSDILSERLEETLIVEQPLLVEQFTIMGKTDLSDPDEGINWSYAEEGLIIPANIAPDFGNITIRLDSTRLTSFSDAVYYLETYPYDCLEQRASRILPLILFGENVKMFGPEWQNVDVKEEIESELKLWPSYQLSDGGFYYWLTQYPYAKSAPYISVKVAHYIRLASQQGFRIPTGLNKSALLDYLTTLVKDPWYSPYIRSYALYVLTLWGEDQSYWADKLMEEGDRLGISGYGFLALSYIKMGNNSKAWEILNRLKNFIKVGTRSIDLVETYEVRHYFDSGVQQLALLLMVYHKLDPGSDMLQRISTSLISRQKGGYWQNTADTAWALTAFAQVFAGETGQDTNFTATVLLNNQELLTHQFKGFSEEPVIELLPLFEEPLSNIERNNLFPLQFNKEGTGMLYYSASIQYALPSEVALPRDEGLGVFSEIYDLEGNRIEGRDLELGKTYKMRVIVSSSKRRTFVALRVPIPSGAEILDASFVTTGSYLDTGGVDQDQLEMETIYGDMYLFSYYPEPVKKIYDNEVQYFFDDFFTGKQEVEFLFRTTTPGVYPTAPACAVCMYEEEVFGREEGKLFVIK